MNHDPSRAEAIFLAAAEIAVPQERAAFLDRECGDGLALRARVEALLASHGEAGDFLENTAPSPEMEAELARLKPEEAGERIGPYKLMEQIGQGGFGTVWVADQEKPVRRRVALKIIKLGMDTKEVIARFEQERQALAMMDHPHIAKVFDAGATQWGRPYFVMELVRGIKITDYCDQANLPTAERLALFIQVCNAVQHAHQKGIIHRDLKPSNILVTLHDGVPVPKVIDFGVAKATQQTRLTDLTIYTQFQQMIGTPLYMSPEQAEMSGLDIDTRSDIYSLGVLLYELLTGRTPFDPEELMRQGLDEIRRTIREREPQKPSTFLSTMAFESRTNVAQHRQVEGAKLVGLLRGDLDWIVMKALEKDRNRRYETASDFARDIQRFIEDQPVSAAAPSASYRFGKFVRRNKAALGVAALIFAILVVATGVSVWQAKVAIEAKKDALAKATAEQAARKEAEAISTFLTEVFQSPDPARDGRTIAVAEMLDRAAKKLDTDLASQPERRAKFLGVMGRTYNALGLYRDAIPLQQRTLDDCQAIFGSEHPDTLTAKHDLAVSYRDAGRVLEAIRMMEEVLTLRRKVLGQENSDTLTTMHNLASCYYLAGRHEAALKLREEVLALRRTVNGSEHPDTLWAASALSASYASEGRFEEARKLSEEALTLNRKVHGPEHTYTIDAIHYLANAYDGMGRSAEALTMRKEVLVLRRRLLGPEHQKTLSAMHNLADSYADAGQMDEAVKLKEELLKLSDSVNGPEHPDTLWAMINLANSYFATSRLDAALKMREEALPLSRKVNGSEHPDTVTAMEGLANSYLAAARTEEALPLLAEESARSPNDTFLALKITTLQAWFGKNADHAATCRRVIELAARTNDPSVADRAAKAYCLLPSSDPHLLEAALTLARRAVDLGKTHQYFPYYQMGLGMAEYRSGSYPAADEALTAAELAGKDNRHVWDTARFFHAMSLFQQGKAAEARTLFAEAEAEMKPLPADERQPFTDGATPDDIVVWLAYKEAKKLLRSSR